MGAPVLGAHGSSYPEAGTWSTSFGWRYQKSDRHFVGDHYEEVRDEIGNQVINTLNLADLSIKYQATRRVELAVGVPFVMVTRSQMLRSQGVNLERYQTQARGIGDIVFGARRWMFDPDSHPTGNFQLGFGAKLPTGENNVTDTFRVLQNNVITNDVRTVDQSIQPGDGGFGLIGEFTTFKAFAKTMSAYGNGVYLANPQGTSKVLTYRGAAGEQYMSIADQYLVRGGVAGMIPGSSAFGWSAGLRLEGVPVNDLLGPSDHFRRPGLALSFEPGVTYAKGKNGVSVAVPIAMYRNRFVSVPDEARGAHGDAAFADWLLMIGYFRRF
jgi:hypothetical protein